MEFRYDTSFEKLYKSYYSKLAVYASFFLNNEDAHDVVQEVFLSLLENKHKKLNELTLNAYLYKAVQNRCIDIIRHNQVKDQYLSDIKKKLLEFESEYFYTFRNEIEDGLLSKELHEQINAAINSLPPKGKLVFKLYFENHKTTKEIAQILGLSNSTIENHIYSCLKVLRRKISGYLLIIILVNVIISFFFKF